MGMHQGSGGLLLRLGLRASEVAELTFDAIDQHWLPRSATYLRRGPVPQVFVSARHRGLGSPCPVSWTGLFVGQESKLAAVLRHVSATGRAEKSITSTRIC